MKVTWLGDGTARQVIWGGLTFPEKQAVDVPNDHPIAKKLAANSHFQVEGYEPPAEQKPKAKAKTIS